MILLVIGPQASGKGTQAEKLAEKFNLAYIEMGSLLRKITQDETPLGNKIKNYVGKGLLVPDELIAEVIDSYLRRIDKLDGTVFDGFPRLVSQAESLEKFLEEKGRKIDLVINLKLPREVTFKRLAGRRTCERCSQVYNLLTEPPKREGVCDICGGKLVVRFDETPALINTRLDEFEKQTKPLIEYFRKRGILEDVDGDRPIDVIFEDILSRLKERGLMKE